MVQVLASNYQNELEKAFVHEDLRLSGLEFGAQIHKYQLLQILFR